MDNLEKKRLANEKRLKAIKEWKKNRNQIVKTSSKNLDVELSHNNKKIYYSDEETDEKNNQLKLFDSDEENDGSEDLGDCFKIRPQFEGRNGQRMLEMNSELSDRFKLDERFREDDMSEEEPDQDENQEDSEKNKNIRILESILGHEVSKKHPTAQKAKRKREIERFNPEDENNESCIKDVEKVSKKPKKKKKKSEPDVPPEEIPISTERYIEVTSNLKQIMNTAGSFSFADKFNVMIDSKEDKKKDKNINDENPIIEKDPSQTFKPLNKVSNQTARNDLGITSGFKDSFFISSSDERLKEGIEFFMRPKPLDQIREEWSKKRDRVMDIFRKRKKSAVRGFTKRPKKKQNVRNKFSSKK